MSISVSGQTPDQVPEPVARVADLMSAFRRRWFLCGGWAVDAWLGRQTRDHQDVDISVFEDDQRALFDHLSGWHLIAHDSVTPDSTESWDGRRLERPAHGHASLSLDAVSAWVSEPAAQHDGFELEVILNERSGREWIFSVDPRLILNLRRCIQRSSWGLPTAVPEILCFYKATAYFGFKDVKERPQDESDFLELLSLLSSTRRKWLREAIARVQPDHPWLAQLSL